MTAVPALAGAGDASVGPARSGGFRDDWNFM